MIDTRQPFDLRDNEALIFAGTTPWWCSNRVLTWGGVALSLLVMVGLTAGSILTVVNLARQWLAQ